MNIDGFTVELVNAETKRPFKEHQIPDGRIYIEVEPDAGYFIRLATDCKREVIGAVEVD